MQRFVFRSRNKDEVERFFSNAWTPSRILMPRNSRGCSVYLSGGNIGNLGFVYARYGSDITWIPQPARNDFVVTSCSLGQATLRENDARAEWWPGAYRAISADSELMISGHGQVEMSTVTVPREVVYRRLEHWLGVKVEEKIHLAQVISPETTHVWAHLAQHARGLALWAPSTVATSMLSDYAADLLINLHRHNYSSALASLPRASDRAMREAWDFIRSQGHRPVSALDVALHARCSLKSLARAFRELHGLSITAALRDHRLRKVESVIEKYPATVLPDIAAELQFPSVSAMLAVSGAQQQRRD